MPKEKKINKKDISKIPKECGIYFFYNKKNKLLYIGKANNLKERIKTHFSQPNYRDNLFINEIEKIGYIPLSSEIEALISESQLIKKLQPKFNILFRDDKKYFYIGITREDWPRIFLTHQPLKIRNAKHEILNKPEIQKNKKISDFGFRISDFVYVGPFTEGNSLKETLKILRKIFPFRSCKIFSKRPCLWYHLEKCPAPCLLEKEEKIRKKLSRRTKERQKEYKANIKKLKEVLEGKRKIVIKKLKKEMKELAKKEEFEKAAILKNKIEALERVFEHKIIFKKPKILEKPINEGRMLKKSLSLKIVPKRIEGYDVSNIKSTEMVGAMTVFSLICTNLNTNIHEYRYMPEKQEYRLFKIKTVKRQNDIACLCEIVSRRLRHKEWKMPDLIYVDGGKAQLNAVKKVMKQFNNEAIPIISLAKKRNILYTSIFKQISLDKLDKVAKMTILRLKDESHRCAITYHKKLRKKSLLTS